MDGWRQMAEPVRGFLQIVGIRTDAQDLIDHAVRKLHSHILTLSAFLDGIAPEEVEIDEIEVQPVPVAVSPSAFLEDAIRVLARDTAPHAQAGHLVDLYAHQHPTAQGTQLWRDWLLFHGYADGNAALAAALLRRALGYSYASASAVHVADATFGRQTNGWLACIAQALHLARAASYDAQGALAEVRLMQRNVLSESGRANALIELGDG